MAGDEDEEWDEYAEEDWARDDDMDLDKVAYLVSGQSPYKDLR